MTTNGRPDLATMPYAEYLQTPEWKERAEAAKKRAGYRCQVCNGSQRLQAHHRDYSRRGHEEDADLTVLCDDCHALFHSKGRMADAPALPARRTPAFGVVRMAPAPTWRRRRSWRRKIRRALHQAVAPGRLAVLAGIVLLVVGLAVLAAAAAAHTG